MNERSFFYFTRKRERVKGKKEGRDFPTFFFSSLLIHNLSVIHPKDFPTT